MHSKRSGVWIALGIIGAWLFCFIRGVFGPQPSSRPIESVFLVIASAFLFTGLFITAHDAMHGTLDPSNRKLNNAIGTVAVLFYALFPFSKLKTEHFLHHRAPASQRDPDFHSGQPGFWHWYWNFVTHYVSFAQFAVIVLAAQIPIHGWGVSPVNVYAFWVLPSFASTLQLFYFGTYLPHREKGGYADENKARSLRFSKTISFLTCYHFSGYHLEHHRYPHVPWWGLPRTRDR